MIGVGITSNVYISKIEMDDKGTLSITFKENTPEAKLNVFQALQQEEVIDANMSGTTVKLFPPLKPFDKDNKGNPLTEDKQLQNVQRDLNKTQSVLIHILKQYATKEAYGRIGKESFSGLDITAENYGTQLVKEEVLKHVHKNRCRVFMEEMQPFVGKEDLLFRLLLRRQSKDKHFATFRTDYVDENPFYESMDIPAEQSKVKWTPGEIKEGLNDPTPTSRETADKPEKDKDKGGSTTQSAANIFGN